MPDFTDPRFALAQDYVDAGYHLFPCSNKDPDKPKKPLEYWTKKEYDPAQDVLLLPTIYGVRLSKTDLVIDYDPRRNAGRDQLKEFCELLGVTLPVDTYTVLTGSVNKDTGEPEPGFHFYFTKPEDKQVRGTLKHFPAIEIKSYGRYVIGPGSIHPSGRHYEIIRGHINARTPASQDLLEYLQADDVDNAGSDDDICDDSAGNRKWIGHDLEFNTDIYQGAFITACRVKEHGVSEEVAYELLRDYWNNRCLPPRSDDELKGKVANAYRYSQNSQGCKLPLHTFQRERLSEILASTDTSAPDVNIGSWDTTKDGTRLGTIKNLMSMFLINENLQGLLKFNEFAHKVEFTRRAIWHTKADSMVWSDAHSSELKLFLSCRGIQTSTELCHEAAILVARRQSYHPIIDWFDKIVWDGIHRLDRILIDYASAEDNEYTREVGKNILIGACARVYKPGCQLDTMVILEGEQGSQKTSFVRILGGEWYGDVKIRSHKDVLSDMVGKWIIEQSELKFRKSEDVEAVKSFLSITSDTARLSYERFSKDLPRQSIFVGTINPGATGSYLTDQTGNRRFWPVKTGKIYLEKLIEDRDQLFAEAVFRFKAGEPHHIVSASTYEAAKAEQEKRTETDPWEDVIRDWLHEAEDIGDFITTETIALRALVMSAEKLNPFATKRIAQAMRKCGWELVKDWFKDEKRQKRGWKRIQVLEESLLEGV